MDYTLSGLLRRGLRRGRDLLPLPGRSDLPRPHGWIFLPEGLHEGRIPPPEEQEVGNLKEDGAHPGEDLLQDGEPDRQDEEDEADDQQHDQRNNNSVHFSFFSFLDS